MSALLSPCPSCARHVRVAEVLCPFCATVQPEKRAARALPTKRLSRAGTFAFGAALAASTATGCSSGTTPGDDMGTHPDMATIDAGGGDSASATDSGPGPDLGPGTDSGPTVDMGTTTQDMGADAGPVAAYGGPPDLGVDFGGVLPAYGISPFDGGTP